MLTVNFQQIQALTTAAFLIAVNVWRRNAIVHVSVQHFPVARCSNVGHVYRNVIMVVSNDLLHSSIRIILLESVTEDNEDHYGNKDGDEGREGADYNADNVCAGSLGVWGFLGLRDKGVFLWKGRERRVIKGSNMVLMILLIKEFFETL